MEEAVDRAVSDVDDAVDCGAAQPCQQGKIVDGVVMVWSSQGNSLLFAATAPDQSSMMVLMDAWRSAVAEAEA